MPNPLYGTMVLDRIDRIDRNEPRYDTRAVNYDRGTFIRFATSIPPYDINFELNACA